ncbi:TonB-dependent receptor [Hyphomonas sp.]|uniref:TonB-dependent receptor n=1 Tax=Hyphomonas sp. TaxID=87 RepID=UPI00391CDE31
MKIDKNVRLLASTAVVWCAALQIATAQEVTDAPAAGTADVAAEAEDVSTRRLTAVTVTAQRREESAQDVPLAVTAVTGEQIQELRVENIENISLISPSISFSKTNSPAASSNIQIRGIGTTGQSRVFEGAVGVFIDGVYRTRSGQALTTFLDIDGLQVLRGPQGTLFGKNTSAGALLLNSKAPDLDSFGGYVSGSYGNYNAVDLSGAVNIPFAENMALRIAGTHSEQDGFLESPEGDTQNDQKVDAFKASLLWEPTPDLSIKLIADYAVQDDEVGYGTFNAVDGPLTPLINGLTLANGYAVPSGNIDDYEASINTPTTSEVVDQGLTLDIEWDLGSGSLSSITAMREYDTDQHGDADFSPADILIIDERFNSKFFSQEFIYNGELEGALNANYLFGAFYSDEELDMGRSLTWGTQAQAFWDPVLAAGGFPFGISNAAPGEWADESLIGTAESLALFTHWDFALNDQFNLITGLRYSQDDKTGAFNYDFFRDPIFDPLAIAGSAPGPVYARDFSDEAMSGTLSLQYSPSSDAMYYASYNRGYKAGGVNIDASGAGVPGSSLTPLVPAVAADPVFSPETVDAFEVGAKFGWMDGSAQTNLAVFYSDIQDLQVAQFLGLIFTILNSPEAQSYGAEFEHTQVLTDNIVWNASATWLPEASFGDDAAIGVLSGRRFSNAPELAGNTSLKFNYDLSDDKALTGLLQVQYAGERFTNTASNLKEDAQTTVNANIGMDFAGGLSVTAFLRNAFDERYVVQHFNTPLQGDDRNAYVSAPRTFGISLRKTF